MAREAGFPFNKYGLLQGNDDNEIDADAMFEAFEALVRADEREACAKVCDSINEKEGFYECGQAEEAAKQIRTRGEIK
jgi:hypothetical protein